MTRSRRWIPSFTALAAALVCSVMAASPTRADITGGALNITAVNAAGDAASFLIPVPPGVTSYTWSSTEITEMRSLTTGDLIATLNPGGLETRVEYIDDPSIGLAFNVQAGSSLTTVTIASALLSFPTISADGLATAGLSLTDFDGDGATLTGVGNPSGTEGSYLAQYNGFAGTLSGTTFAEVIHSITAGVYATATASATVPPLGFLQIVDPVSDMSVLFSFRLTAHDLASGTSNFVIVERPLATEPATWGGTKSLFR